MNHIEIINLSIKYCDRKKNKIYWHDISIDFRKSNHYEEFQNDEQTPQRHLDLLQLDKKFDAITNINF